MQNYFEAIEAKDKKMTIGYLYNQVKRTLKELLIDLDLYYQIETRYIIHRHNNNEDYGNSVQVTCEITSVVDGEILGSLIHSYLEGAGHVMYCDLNSDIPDNAALVILKASNTVNRYAASDMRS